LGYTVGMKPTFLSALAEPNRMRIVELLREGPRPVGEIAGRLRIRQPQVSKHLRVLSQAGLVKVKPVANLRVYQLEAGPFVELEDWLETFRRSWDQRLDNLDEYMKERKEERRIEASNRESLK
jgi:DNA-binding transcriptional ArsR family regulator